MELASGAKRTDFTSQEKNEKGWTISTMKTIKLVVVVILCLLFACGSGLMWTGIIGGWKNIENIGLWILVAFSCFGLTCLVFSEFLKKKK